jgi:TetR/AcrR family transcriptional regulator, cholesterol catabolism regulator
MKDWMAFTRAFCRIQRDLSRGGRRCPVSSKPLRIRSNPRVHSKSIEKRQRILDAAARALAEHGYAEAKLSDIAQEAGTHAGSLYYYFPSREDLMKEVLLTSLDRMSSELSDVLEDEDAHLSALDRVMAFVRVVIKHQTSTQNDYYLRAYMRNGNQVPESMRKLLRTRRHRMRRTLARLIREAQAADQIPAQIDTSVAAHFVIGAINWLGVWYEPTGRNSADKITRTFVDLALHGLVGAQGKNVTTSSVTKTTAR